MMAFSNDKMGKGDNFSSDEELYNPSQQAGSGVWEPDPKTIIALYEKLDKDGVLELQWKSPGRLPINEQVTPVKQIDIVQETPEHDLKLREKQKLLSMFEADDLSNMANTPNALNKTPKAPKSTVKAKASFDKIFSRVSHKSPKSTVKPKASFDKIFSRVSHKSNTAGEDNSTYNTVDQWEPQ